MMRKKFDNFNLMYYSIWNSKNDARRSIHAKSLKQRVKFKHGKTVKSELYRKISLLMSIGALDKILFLKMKLKQIQLTKELFLFDIEHSSEVYIPDELRQDELPKSYLYYDFLINFLQDNVSWQKRQKILYKTSFSRNFFSNPSTLQKICNFFVGENRSSPQEIKPRVRHQFANNNSHSSIDYSKSHHVNKV